MNIKKVKALFVKYLLIPFLKPSLQCVEVMIKTSKLDQLLFNSEHIECMSTWTYLSCALSHHCT